MKNKGNESKNKIKEYTTVTELSHKIEGERESF